MPDNSDPERERIHEAIASNAAHVQDASGGAILTGWIVISEWMDKDGERYLGHCRAASTSAWTARGMMHDVLFGNWPDGSEPD
jgi:hypothetical protein